MNLAGSNSFTTFAISWIKNSRIEMGNKTKDSSFLIRVKDKTGKIIDNGTGFFINSDGNFISAGHVFSSDDYQYFCEIDGQTYPISVVFREYTPQDEYTDTIYKDFLIGKVNLIPKDFLKLSDKKPSVGEVVTISGFNQKRPANPDIMDLDDLFNAVEEGLVQVDDGDQRYFNEFETKTTVTPLVKFNQRNKKHFVMSNIVSIEEIIAPGLSGGPLTLSEICYGIVNVPEASVSSIHIIERLKQEKIVHHLAD